MQIKCGYLPPKHIEYDYPQHAICMHLIDLYYMTNRLGKNYKLSIMTMIDSTTGQLKIVETKNKTVDHIGILLDYTQFSKYPRLVQAIFDNSNKFLGKDFREILDSYSVIPKLTIVKNMQANLVECMH